MKPNPGHGGPQRLVPSVVLLVLVGILVNTVGGIPTSVLASAKDRAADHDDDGGGGGANSESDPIHQQPVTASPPDARNQISVPQKRGVNPLLYNDFQYSGNSIPHGGQWDDDSDGFDLGPLSAAALYPALGPHHSDGAATARMRNYDVLASLLGPPPQPVAQTFYDGPVTPSVSYPSGYGYYGLLGADRSKRMAASYGGHGKPSQRQRSLSSRTKRSPGKLSAADALSLLAILDARDPYSPAALPSSSDYFPYLPSVANGPNDVLPYSPSSNLPQDIPLSLALAQLLAERNNVGGGGGGPLLSFNGDGEDGDGQWMNTWTEPGVDYLGFPMDVGAGAASALPRFDGDYGFGGGKPSKIGFTPQKRFMVSKRKRSVGSQQDNGSHGQDSQDDSSCTSDKKTCLLRKYFQLAAAKVAPA